MSSKKKIFFLTFLILLYVENGFSQGPPPPPNPPGLPIDGISGLLFLFISGIIYGSKKIFKDSSS